jgi:hypothetical protein
MDTGMDKAVYKDMDKDMEMSTDTDKATHIDRT